MEEFEDEGGAMVHTFIITIAANESVGVLPTACRWF